MIGTSTNDAPTPTGPHRQLRHAAWPALAGLSPSPCVRTRARFRPWPTSADTVTNPFGDQPSKMCSACRSCARRASSLEGRLDDTLAGTSIFQGAELGSLFAGPAVNQSRIKAGPIDPGRIQNHHEPRRVPRGMKPQLPLNACSRPRWSSCVSGSGAAAIRINAAH